MKVLAINASLSGTKTGRAMDALSFSSDVEYELINLKDLDMAFADGRDYREYDNDNSTIIQKMIEADAIIIGTPIFQSSIPGVLKNLFDLLPINALQGKTVGIVVTAGSARHYLVAEHQLIPILNYLKTDVISKYVFMEPNDFTENSIEDDIALRLETLTRSVEDRVTLNKQLDKQRYDFL